MKKLFFLLIAVVLFCSHDMYLKLDTYFLQANSKASIQLFNGTFDLSENVIDRNRMIDASLLGQGKRISVDTNQWSEDGGTTILNFTTGEAGTWVAGVSTRPRNIEMTAEDFNGYLEHDGVLDMLEWRKENNALDKDAIEKYSKHVKTIFQVGEQLTEDWKTVLGYPIEFVPLNNPYDIHPGHDMQVQLLWQGKPLANQLVYLGSKHKDGHSHNDDEKEHEHADGTKHTHAEQSNHDHTEEEGHTHDLTQFRTDAEGKLKLSIEHQGIYYLRTIHLVQSEEEGLTHESNWATLSFEVGDGSTHHQVAEHSHDHDDDHDHSHDHDHDHQPMVPSYVYWLGSLGLFVGLFFWFNRKK